ncbi:MAG: GTPase Era [Bacteroidia bacterium]|nr:GTPase Era [Bacteroidia bacterium]MDW8235917.1 GTPase Era [Bacteroidia bacterium]
MTQAGFVALVGTPNAGKSTLLNRLVGHPLAAITPKPQTTRFAIPGILTQPERQFIFMDTPGWISSPRNAWHRILNQQTLATLRKADVLVWVIALSQEPNPPPPEFASLLQRSSALISAYTHADLFPPPQQAIRLQKWKDILRPYPYRSLIDSSLSQPIEPLLEAIAALLPSSPFLYPPDELTTLPVRFFVAEIIRRALYENLREELPYSSEAEIVSFKEEAERIYIHANLWVEKLSQKPIVIGKDGDMIKRIGTQARKDIAAWLQKPIYLELYVKVAPKWRQSRTFLRTLGYRNP